MRRMGRGGKEESDEVTGGDRKERESDEKNRWEEGVVGEEHCKAIREKKGLGEQ